MRIDISVVAAYFVCPTLLSSISVWFGTKTSNLIREENTSEKRPES
jgi:hypothetical protein